VKVYTYESLTAASHSVGGLNLTKMKVDTVKNTGLKAYQTVNKNTGEVKNRFKYMVGMPRQYRFNGQNGRFNMDGIKDKGIALTVVPIAWRVFTADNLFGRDRLEKWVELFFVDADNCVSSIMFNNTSADIFQQLLGQLMYADLTILEVTLTITADRRTNTNVNKNYFVAQFNFEKVASRTVDLYASFTADQAVYREDTITDSEVVSLSSLSYRPDIPQVRTLLQAYEQGKL
jgi:hypothetical protein